MLLQALGVAHRVVGSGSTATHSGSRTDKKAPPRASPGGDLVYRASVLQPIEGPQALMRMSTPAGMFSLLSASTVLEVGSEM